ncbi:hypothetical protein OSSY52_18840 [Tepiditoga spiralis]|uniref:Protein argonaute n=1 Tax=Tepiditoga spiralis TaxID=2108365 RepID=A0A7G1G9R9_9BACT|nr:hypothetical protein [Tepiditoga spiralis]BBE31743.1 hypothetical protein OSSY52_18840 [Tepiditoga spiralis]
MTLNLFKIIIPKEVKRIYFYKKEISPEIFAKNLKRVNNIKFTYSNDLIWVELPNIKLEIKPKEVMQYKIEKEEVLTVQKDEKLFLKMIYSYVQKLFLDNEFYHKNGNEYISLKDKFELKSNKNIMCHKAYKVKIYKIDDEYYLSINPKFVFLSKLNALESQEKGVYLFNTKSGKTFPYISSIDNKLTIELKNGDLRIVNYPENYYFNYSSKEAEFLGFSKEIYTINKEKFNIELKEISSKLNFLKDILDIKNKYEIPWDNRKYLDINYIFKNGTSKNAKDMFKYSFYKNEKDIKILFFFNSEKQFFRARNILKELFSNKNSIFYNSIKQLGFNTISYVKNKETNKSIFFYDEETYEIKDKSFIENLGIEDNYIGITFLDNFLGNIELLMNKMPKNIIFQPVLMKNINSMKPFIIKSFVYKLAKFLPGNTPFIINNLKEYKEDLFIGLDMSHDNISKKTHFSITAVENNGNILYLNRIKELQLNEKIKLDLFEKEYINIINKYETKHKKLPKRIFLYRDGIYLENIERIKNIVEYKEIKGTFIEVNKNSNINSTYDLKDNIIKISNEIYVYFPKTMHKQKGIELKIIYNNVKIENEKIAFQGFMLSKLYYSTPYSNIKLPYPIHITNKVALNDLEWKLYIPYFE